MKQENNYDEIDKMLFEHFEKDTEIPESTKNTIHNAFNLPARKRQNNLNINTLQKVALLLITFIVITTGIVFAKDIVNFISKIFTNSTKGIDAAVENGYVQNVDMDFVVDNDIGIKVDNLIMDENNLDISFVYYTDVSNIKDIEINEFIIRDENNNIICFKLENSNKLADSNILSTSCNRINQRILNDKNQFTESFLVNSLNIFDFKEITFEIESFTLTDNTNTKQKQTGTWLYTIGIEDKIMKRTTQNYTTSYNQYIKNISTTLSETSLNIDIELNEIADENILLEPNNIILKNNIQEEYPCIYKNISIKNNTTSITLKFDISKYHDNINILNLLIKFNVDKIIDIYLSK